MSNLIELSTKTVSASKLKKLKRIATAQLESSTHMKPMVAIIVRGKRVIGTGTNKAKTHTKQAEHSKYKDDCKSVKLHAEIAVLNNTPRDLIEGADIYILRIRRMDGSLGTSAPCSACLSACVKAGIRRIYYVEEEKETTR